MSPVGQLTDSANFQTTCHSRESQLRLHESQIPNKTIQERDFINQMNENIFPGVPVVCVCVRHERLQLCPKQP